MMMAGACFSSTRRQRIKREPAAIGAALFGRGDFAAVARMPTTELVWLLGPMACANSRRWNRDQSRFALARFRQVACT
jgi:hypothetical protein